MRFVNIKTIILVIIIIILLFIIKDILTSIFTMRQNSEIVISLKKQEQSEKEREKFLKQKLYLANTPEFIENEAREKLGMVKPGEHIVLAPQTEINEIDKEPDEHLTNIEKWWKVFFSNSSD